MIPRPRCCVCGAVWGKPARGPEIFSAAWPKAQGWEHLHGEQWDCNKHAGEYVPEWQSVERAKLPS